MRALGLRKAQHGEWELIQKVNGLRNELAHQLRSPDRDKKVGQLRDVYRREAAGLEHADEVAEGQDAVLISSACALVLRFLSAMHADSEALRRWIYTLDRTLNPELPPFEP